MTLFLGTVEKYIFLSRVDTNNQDNSLQCLFELLLDKYLLELLSDEFQDPSQCHKDEVLLFHHPNNKFDTYN